MDGTRVELNPEHKGPVCALATLVVAGYLKEEGRRLGVRPSHPLCLMCAFTPRAARPQLVRCPHLKVNSLAFPLGPPTLLELTTCQSTIWLEAPTPLQSPSSGSPSP